MVSTDPIADMLSRIRNAILVEKNQVTMPHSKIKHKIAQELAKSKFVDSVSTDDNEGRKQLIIVINQPGAAAKITSIERISKPGRRAYSGADDLPRVKNGRGIVIVSTSQGVMTGRQAIKKRLGGELICKVY